MVRGEPRRARRRLHPQPAGARAGGWRRSSGSGGRSPGCRSSARRACARRSRRRSSRCGSGPTPWCSPRRTSSACPQQIFAEPFYPQAGLSARPAGEPRRSGPSWCSSCRSAATTRSCPRPMPRPEARRAAARRLRGGRARGSSPGRRAGTTSSAGSAPRPRACRSRIWRQEDYRANAQAIMETVCGCPRAAARISEPTWTRSPSAAAIAAAEALPADMPMDERAGAGARRSSRPPSPSGDRFRPFIARRAAAAARRATRPTSAASPRRFPTC